MAFDVFISFKKTAFDGGLTADHGIARELHRKLRDEGLEVFFSEKDLITTEFMNEIYRALEEASLLILVGSSIDYIHSKWVKSEWQNFLGAMNIGKKANGQIMTVLTGIANRDLPIELANFQSFSANDLDSAVDYAFKVLGKVKRSEAAAWLAQEEERKQKEAEEAELRAVQQRLEEERKTKKAKDADERKRRRDAAKAQRSSITQSGKNRGAKIAAIAVCAALILGGAIGVVYVRQQEKPEIAEEQVITEEQVIAEEQQPAELDQQAPVAKTDADVALDEIFGFERVGDSIAITRHFGNGGDVVVPESYTGSPVVEIGSGAFQQGFGFTSNVTSITLPDSVKKLGDSAFAYCRKLTLITLPDSVTSIGDKAFSYCTSLASITIPNSVTFIGSFAFSQCTSLTSIIIPDSVIFISDSAFSYCRSMTSVTIPNSVTFIGSCAFYDCSSLTSITIPNRVTSIGKEAFFGCNKLTSIIIPDSVTDIGEDAFSGCSITVTAPHDPSYYGYTPDDGVTWVVE